MKDFKVAKEVAEADFEKFCEAMDLDLDPKSMDQDDLKGFEQNKGRIVQAIMRGSLVVDGEGVPIFTPTMSTGIVLTFSEPKGSTFLAMDGKKKGADMAKTFAVLAEMTGQQSTVFQKMKSRDLKVCQAIFALFLG